MILVSLHAGRASLTERERGGWSRAYPHMGTCEQGPVVSSRLLAKRIPDRVRCTSFAPNPALVGLLLGLTGVGGGLPMTPLLLFGVHSATLRGFDKVASGSYITCMRSVGLKLLKNKLSEYVRLAAGGETVLVTDRDRVVAEIGPPRPTRSPLLSDALWLDACRQGWITPPVLIGREPPARQPVMTIDELLSDLQRDRAER